MFDKNPSIYLIMLAYWSGYYRFLKIYFHFYLCTSICSMYMPVCTEARRRSTGAGALGGCEPPDMDAGSHTQVL